MEYFDYILFAISILLMISVFASKISSKISLPLLITFLGIGMLAGSEGIGKIYFDNIKIAQNLGIVALAIILFSGGLSAEHEYIKNILKKGISLSSLGVILTCIITAIFAKFLLNINIKEALLVGSIVSSTDASAVFSILRSKNISLKGDIKPLLEFESSSNDPIAFILTIISITLLKNSNFNVLNISWLLIKNIFLGIFIGISFGNLLIKILNTLKLEYYGLYATFSLASIIFTYYISTLLGGNGFLAVYLLGLVISKRNFFWKKFLLDFYETINMLMQILIFLMLGLLVFPTKLIHSWKYSLILSIILIFIARPVAVFLSLSLSKISFKEKIMISWVGLRGAAPIVLATFPVTYNIMGAYNIFNIVFFAVCISCAIQGSSINYLAKMLKLTVPYKNKAHHPIEIEESKNLNAELFECYITDKNKIVGKAISELIFPQSALVLLIFRNQKYVIVKGNTIIKPNDTLIFLANKKDFFEIKKTLLII